jgi:AcrR family transcriptional regulator
VTGMFSWDSPSSRPVLNAALDTLAELGFDGLTVTEITTRAGAAGPALGETPDLEALVVAALEHVQLFPGPEPTGHLSQDLRTLLEPWRTSPSRDEGVIAAVLSAAMWRPRLRVALHEALDRPLTHTVAAMVARAGEGNDIPPRLIQTICLVLRGMLVDRLRSGPRSPVEIDRLVEFLITGLRLQSDSSGPGQVSPPAAHAPT